MACGESRIASSQTPAIGFRSRVRAVQVLCRLGPTVTIREGPHRKRGRVRVKARRDGGHRCLVTREGIARISNTVSFVTEHLEVILVNPQDKVCRTPVNPGTPFKLRARVV